jgi:hypothetical protein
MRKVVILVGVVAGGALLALAPASASAAGSDHTVTSTQNTHGQWTEQDVNPCNGDVLDVTFDGNMVQHVTFFPASDEVWATFTETGQVQATDEGTGVVYAGRATAWGNFNMNQQNANQTFTLNVRATGSDGSLLIAHDNAHFALNANGVVTVTFDKLNLTCG